MAYERYTVVVEGHTETQVWIHCEESREVKRDFVIQKLKMVKFKLNENCD